MRLSGSAAPGSAVPSFKTHVRVVIKIGGAVVTDKSQLEFARPEVIRCLAEDLAPSCAAGPDVVLVHGAGSFGHPQARDTVIAMTRCVHAHSIFLS